MGGFISVAKGATLNDNRTSLACNYGTIIYNRGTFNTGTYDIGNNASIYNEGTFTATGALSYSAGASNTSYFYNNGDEAELIAPSMTLNSTCNFISDGTAIIAGDTFVTKDGITWINNGHYTTGTLTFSAKNTSFYNYCQLFVTDNAHMYDGEFNLMSGSYAEIGTADFDNFIVNMNGNAGFNVLGDNTWGPQGDGTFQGFNAKGDNNYVLLGGNTTVAGHLYSLETKGKITIAVNNIIDLGANNSGVQPTYLFGENHTRATYGELIPTYNETDCGATWTDNPPIVVPPVQNQTWTYAFEDNKTRCDFDMNDVVIQVKVNDEDANMLDITLVAAGCQYDNYVWLGDTQITWDGQAEVHDAFGADRGVMVNTGNGKGIDLPYVTTTINKPADLIDLQNADFKIRPYKTRTTEPVTDDYITITKVGDTENGLAKAPLGIAIPDVWKWPKERVIVTNAYSGFSAWGKQTDLTLRAEEGGWYKEPTDGQVYEQ